MGGQPRPAAITAHGQMSHEGEKKRGEGKMPCTAGCCIFQVVQAQGEKPKLWHLAFGEESAEVAGRC